MRWGKNENDRVTSPESVPVLFKIIDLNILLADRSANRLQNLRNLHEGNNDAD